MYSRIVLCIDLRFVSSMSTPHPTLYLVSPPPPHTPCVTQLRCVCLYYSSIPVLHSHSVSVSTTLPPPLLHSHSVSVSTTLPSLCYTVTLCLSLLLFHACVSHSVSVSTTLPPPVLHSYSVSSSTTLPFPVLHSVSVSTILPSLC